MRVIVDLIFFAGSFLFYSVWRLFYRIIAAVDLKRNQKGVEQPHWETMSELCENPRSLNLTMVIAPRWNCHALIAKAGPFRVERELAIEAQYLETEESVCFVAIYDDRFEIAYLFDSREANRPNFATNIALSPGLYLASYRGYSPNPSRLPQITIDGRSLVGARNLEDAFIEHQAFLHSLSKKKKWPYLAANYYIFVLLKYRNLFSKNFIEDAYLPVGNPGTNYAYGQVDKESRIEISIAPERFEDALYFLTVYDLYSLPQFWQTVDRKDFRSKPVECDGYYLIRIQEKQAGDKTFDSDSIDHKVVVGS
jgi:hypothetical protein